MKKTFLAMLAGASIMLGACSPTYDSDNPKESFAAMTEGLDSDKKVKFMSAVALIKLKYRKNPEEAKAILDGKTVDEIIEFQEKMGPVSVDIIEYR